MFEEIIASSHCILYIIKYTVALNLIHIRYTVTVPEFSSSDYETFVPCLLIGGVLAAVVPANVSFYNYYPSGGYMLW